jgi:POT family proton-dependent oligopeptide transporter
MIGALYLDTRVNYLFYLLTGSFIFIIAVIFSDKNLTPNEKQRIWVMVIIAFFVIFFWGAYEQTGASLSVFATSKPILTCGEVITCPPAIFNHLTQHSLSFLRPSLPGYG